MSPTTISRETIEYIAMPNIVHFGKFYPPRSGGIERVTESIARGAVRAGYAVEVVCFAEKLARRPETREGVEITSCPVNLTVAGQPIGLGYLLQCFISSRKANLVHCHAPNFLAALCAMFIRRNTALLVHWHSDVVKKGALGLLVRPLEYLLLRRADCIVATSLAYVEASRPLARHRSKITVVPIGCPDAKPNDDDQTEFPPDLEFQIGSKKVIISVGRLVRYKGFEVLVESAQYLPEDTVVVIVGQGPLERSLQLAIKRLGLQNRVVLAGRVDDRTLRGLYRRSILYCMPSTDRSEAFGVVLIEAMACGLPIVACAIEGSGVPWVNQHGVSGLNVPVGNSKALAAACKEILNSEDLRSKFSLGARERFTNEFTETLSVRRITDIYARFFKHL